MIDRDVLVPHFGWLRASHRFDEMLGEAALAIELVAAGHGTDRMRYGRIWISAKAVTQALELESFVLEVRESRRRAAITTARAGGLLAPS